MTWLVEMGGQGLRSGMGYGAFWAKFGLGKIEFKIGPITRLLGFLNEETSKIAKIRNIIIQNSYNLLNYNL